MEPALAARIARDVGTPAAVVDLDRLEANIARVQAACDAVGVANRPHIKTHKSPVVATMQREAGARGITCQKLGEAEIMADAGFDDILVSYNIMGEEKIDRLAALMGRTHMTVASDNPVSVASAAAAAGKAGRRLDVVVECDTGRRRAGVETVAEAVELAALIEASPGLAFAGFLLYPPEDRMEETQAFLDGAKAALRERGLPQPRIVSTGGTPNLRNLGRIKGATEHRPGTYVFNDRMTMAAGAATLEDCALRIVATVVSRNPGRGILDCGSKTLTSDLGKLTGHGLIVEHPDAVINTLAEEHGFLDLSRVAEPVEIGEVVSVVPNHVCPVVNLMDRLITVRGGEIVGELPVAARGRIR